MPTSKAGSTAYLISLILIIVLSGSFYTGHLPFYSTDSEDRRVVSEAHAQASEPQDSSLTVTVTYPAGVAPAIPSQPEVTTKAPAEAEREGSTGTQQEQSELSEIVAYIAYKFEPEGKDVVVRAINCFYSESGLRSNAVGQNNDAPKSKDFGVAQLNDYWHNLTEEQKTDYKANIDKAYDIYKGRGNSFEAWYGKLCN